MSWTGKSVLGFKCVFHKFEQVAKPTNPQQLNELTP